MSSAIDIGIFITALVPWHPATRIGTILCNCVSDLSTPSHLFAGKLTAEAGAQLTFWDAAADLRSAGALLLLAPLQAVEQDGWVAVICV